MKKYLVVLCAFVLFVFCEKPEPPEIIHNAVTDVDGNQYDAVRIGNQVWMTSNLRTTHYADGTVIPMGTEGDVDIYAGILTTKPRRYCPDGVEGNVEKYGYLYNWYAVTNGASSDELSPIGVQGICPTGWHVPSELEWDKLETAVVQKLQHGENIAQALALDNDSWIMRDGMGVIGMPDFEPNNSTGFSAMPAGYYDGSFNEVGASAYFWCDTKIDDYNAKGRFLYYYYNDLSKTSLAMCHGLSVRCVKD